jgi:hypothetical protein
MHRLWQRKSFPVDPRYPDEEGNIDYDASTGNTGALTNTGTGVKAHRLVLPRGGAEAYPFPVTPSPTAGTGSLEERGIRGWINQYEFLPRGALIELVDVSATEFNIIITRDDRSDTATFSDPNKVWRSPTGAPYTQTYRMRIRVQGIGGTETTTRYVGAPGYETTVAGPTVTGTYGGRFNGVICAEGNVRVRGSIGNKDITIASMGNIYIEGSVRRDRANRNGRIALLAKNNVVLNPTQFLARPVGMQNDGPGVATTGAGAYFDANELSVADATRFRVGDMVRIDNGSDWLTVQSVTFGATGNSGRIGLATPHNVAVGDSAILNVLSDTAAIMSVNRERYYELNGANNTLVRDVLFDGVLPTTSTTLSWRHSGVMSTAFRIQNTGAAETFSVKKNTIPSVPEVISAGTTSLDNEKKLLTGATEYDLLDITGTPSGRGGDNPPNPADAENLEKLRNLFNGYSIPTLDANGNPVTDPLTGAPAVTVIPDSNPSWELDFGTTLLTTPARRIAAIPNDVTLATNESYPVPFATALRQFWQQDLSTLSSATTPYRVIGSSFDPDGNEDIATVDASFYQRVNPVGNVAVQASMLPYNPGAPLTPNASGSNVLALSRDPGPPVLLNLGVAGYRFTRPRLEDDQFSAATGNFQPGLSINIDATIFAQEGSWFVIPAPMEVVAPVDADNSNVVEPSEQAAADAATTRYRRLNYRIAVRGTIAQNMTPTGMTDYDDEQTPDQLVTDTTAPGAMQQWIDSLSHPTVIGADLRGREWMGIYYAADPIDYNANNGGAGLYLPVSPDLLYVG